MVVYKTLIEIVSPNKKRHQNTSKVKNLQQSIGRRAPPRTQKRIRMDTILGSRRSKTIVKSNKLWSSTGPLLELVHHHRPTETFRSCLVVRGKVEK